MHLNHWKIVDTSERKVHLRKMNISMCDPLDNNECNVMPTWFKPLCSILAGKLFEPNALKMKHSSLSRNKSFKIFHLHLVSCFKTCPDKRFLLEFNTRLFVTKSYQNFTKIFVLIILIPTLFLFGLYFLLAALTNTVTLSLLA